MRLSRAALLVAPVVLVAAMSGPAATAEVGHRSDPTGDVTSYDLVSGEQTSIGRKGHSADITGYRFDHGTKRFTATVRLRDLDRSQPVLGVIVPIVYPGKDQLEYVALGVVMTPKHKTGRASLDGHPGCAVRHHVSFKRDRVRMSFPTRCLGTPTWVRAYATSVAKVSPGDSTVWYLDAAPDNDAGRPGPKLTRG